MDWGIKSLFEGLAAWQGETNHTSGGLVSQNGRTAMSDEACSGAKTVSVILMNQSGW